MNDSQREALLLLSPKTEQITIIRGPPGTGKTTTFDWSKGKNWSSRWKVLVSAPSNTRVDNIAKGLIQQEH
ncbi:MAG: AAA family ATPase [Chitinophagaceae bacterium]|nr:AAA family ATPase [Chitinophagaceae bacterium]